MFTGLFQVEAGLVGPI